MTVSLVVNNPAQTISIDMLQEQPTQTQSLIITTGSVVVARQPVSAVEMPLLGESGLNIDFLINEYAWKG
jgi:hypothetical protein